MKGCSALSSPPGASAALLILLTTPSLISALSLPNSEVVWARPRTPSSSPDELFGRDSSCGDSSYVQCASSSLPSDFCCPSGSTCMPLAGNTTAICCPSGGDCAEIESIPCQLSLEDKSQHPAAVVMTTALTGTLETCGQQCCPFGYSCNSAGNCDMDSDQSTKPITSSVASSTTATATSGSSTATAEVNPTSGSDSSPTATNTASTSSSSSSSGSGSGSGGSPTASTAADSTSASGSGDSSPESSSGSSDSSSKAGVVAGGVIGGIAGAIFLGLLILFCVKREMKRKKAQEANDDPSRSRSSSFGNILANPVTKGSGSTRTAKISKPILGDEDMVRSDFGRKTSPHFPSAPLTGDSDGAGLRAAPQPPNGRSPSEYYGSEKNREDDDDDNDDDDERFRHGGGDEWSDAYNSEREDGLSNIHEVLRSPPHFTAPRAVSSMYASYYDPVRASEYPTYQAPLKMPSARAFGGSDAQDSPGGGGTGSGPGSGPYGGRRLTRAPSDGYIDVFADSNALVPPPLGLGGDQQRNTRFSDVVNDARNAMG